jgi:hypothetical protein
VFQVAKLTKAAARRRVQESIGKLAIVRDSGHLTTANMEKLWKMQTQLMNMANQLK